MYLASWKCRTTTTFAEQSQNKELHPHTQDETDIQKFSTGKDPASSEESKYQACHTRKMFSYSPWTISSL